MLFSAHFKYNPCIINFSIRMINSQTAAAVWKEMVSLSGFERCERNSSNMKFGDVLRELLEEQDLSQKQLADALNISASAIGNYVRNNREPDFETLKRIARYFSVSTDFLLNYRADSNSDYRDQKLLQIFHSLTEDQKDLYIEQGKLFIRSNSRKKIRLSDLNIDNAAI